jgi:flagellar basal-body rod protein FlgB
MADSGPLFATRSSMFIRELATADAMPALEATIRFAARRQQHIVNNIANIDTPYFKPSDVEPREFQAALGAAIDQRREKWGSHRGDLNFRSGNTIRAGVDFFGRPSFDLVASPTHDNILFHDQNDRSVERLMQDLVENTATFQLATQLQKARSDLLNSAIAERV